MVDCWIEKPEVPRSIPTEANIYTAGNFLLYLKKACDIIVNTSNWIALLECLVLKKFFCKLKHTDDKYSNVAILLGYMEIVLLFNLIDELHTSNIFNVQSITFSKSIQAKLSLNVKARTLCMTFNCSLLMSLLLKYIYSG